ncbi:MAG TPA: hypothetical protein VN661_07530 [Candidatus Acidoferrales bacterium]|nr:hypothetical protein [Candidatus Acidoferrales bacterium]
MLTRSLVLVAFLVLAGCGKSSNAPNPTADNNSGASDSAASAPASTSTAQAEPAAKPAPASPIVVPAGKVLVVTVDQEISTKTSQEGDRFDASLAEPVTVNGMQVIPSGARASGTIVQSKSAGRVKGGSVLEVALDSVTVHGRKYSVDSTSYEEAGKGRGKRTLVGGGGGAALGAIVGAIAGGGKGAAIGAAAGGGAGTAGAAFTGKRDIVIPAETRLHFKLKRSLKIQRE